MTCPHNFSAVDLGGVWQIDAGHARGMGDTGAASTFVQVNPHSNPGSPATWHTTTTTGGAYTLRHTGFLVLEHPVYLPSSSGFP